MDPDGIYYVPVSGRGAPQYSREGASEGLPTYILQLAASSFTFVPLTPIANVPNETDVIKTYSHVQPVKSCRVSSRHSHSIKDTGKWPSTTVIAFRTYVDVGQPYTLR